jgi:pyruvate carboxylase subunit B
MHGTILEVLVREGDPVRAGEPVAILEAMKMETHISSAAGGTVTAVHVERGAVVEAGDRVATVG